MTLWHVEQPKEVQAAQFQAGAGASFRWVVDDASLPKLQQHYSNYPERGNRWSEFAVVAASEFKMDIGGMQDMKRPYLYLQVDGARIKILEQQLDDLLILVPRVAAQPEKKLACPWARAYWFSAATWASIYQELQGCKVRN